LDKSVQEIYGNRIRTRVCGVCLKNGTILLVNHGGLYGHDFWAPPGGGIEFGQSIHSNLEREFLEETGLSISVGDFRFACEFIQPPLHAVELFFNVSVNKGELIVGSDPESDDGYQIITDVAYLSFNVVNRIPDSHKHGLFKWVKSIENIQQLKGYLKL